MPRPPRAARRLVAPWSATSASARRPSSRSTVRSAATRSTARPRRRCRGVRAFVADDDARVLVLTGGGDAAFCAGADLKAIETLEADAPGGPLGFTRLTSPKPTIAAISGWCLAGGLELALWCDLRVARRGRHARLPERRWGVPLIDGGTQRLPRIVGLGRALDLDPHGPDGRCRRGARDRPGDRDRPAGEPLERALEKAEALASFPQETMLADRRSVIEGFGLPLEEGLALEARLGRGCSRRARRRARFAGGEGRCGAGSGI